MKLEITYKNGNSLVEDVNYLHIENGYVYYTIKSQVHEVIQDKVKINLDHVESIRFER